MHVPKMVTLWDCRRGARYCLLQAPRPERSGAPLDAVTPEALEAASFFWDAVSTPASPSRSLNPAFELYYRFC